MGCGATTNKTNAELNQLNRRKLQIVQSIITSLRPNQFIDQSKFDELYNRVKTIFVKNISCESFRDKETYQCSNQELIDRWKLLLLGSEDQLFQQKYNGIQEKQKYHKCFEQIEIDCRRTFPDQAYFDNESNLKLFKRVLRKLAVYLPAVGYTQGISFLVGYLLIMGVEQLETFWMVVHLLLNEKYLLLGMFQDGFPLCKLFSAIFDSLLKIHAPILHTHLCSIQLHHQLWVLKWLMTCYVYSLDFDSVKFVWDYVVITGGLGLVYFGVALVKSLQNQLVTLKEDIDVAMYLQNLKYVHLNIDQIIGQAFLMQISEEAIKNMTKQITNHNKFQDSFYIQFFVSNKQTKEYLRKNWLQKLDQQRSNYVTDLNARQKEQFLVLPKSRSKKRKINQQKLYLDRIQVLDETDLKENIQSSNNSYSLQVDKQMEIQKQDLVQFDMNTFQLQMFLFQKPKCVKRSRRNKSKQLPL